MFDIVFIEGASLEHSNGQHATVVYVDSSFPFWAVLQYGPNEFYPVEDSSDYNGNIDWFILTGDDAAPMTLPEARDHITARVIARRFAQNLLTELGSGRFAEMVMRNRGDEYRAGDICASHEFCDANIPMLEAFRATLGRDPDFLANPDGGVDQTLWNRAWAIAKAEHLTASDDNARI